MKTPIMPTRNSPVSIPDDSRPLFNGGGGNQNAYPLDNAAIKNPPRVLTRRIESIEMVDSLQIKPDSSVLPKPQPAFDHLHQFCGEYAGRAL